MPAVAGNNLGLNWGWSIGENGWKAGTDSNYELLELLVQPNVFDKDLAAPPGSPATGDRYLIPTGATGDWAGHANKLTIWTSSAWLKIAPLEGWRVWVADENTWYQFTGTAWIIADRNVSKVLASASGTITVNYNDGDYYTWTLTENVTAWAFTNLPGAGKAATLRIRITQHASAPKTVAWDASFKWAAGVAPVVSNTNSAVDVLTLRTFDNGTTWQAELEKGFA